MYIIYIHNIHTHIRIFVTQEPATHSMLVRASLWGPAAKTIQRAITNSIWCPVGVCARACMCSLNKTKSYGCSEERKRSRARARERERTRARARSRAREGERARERERARTCRQKWPLMFDAAAFAAVVTYWEFLFLASNSLNYYVQLTLFLHLDCRTEFFCFVLQTLCNLLLAADTLHTFGMSHRGHLLFGS